MNTENVELTNAKITISDISPSPLYAFRQSIHGGNQALLTESKVLGVFWALVIIISIKYLIFMLRADNEGEGGILALLTLLLGRNNGDLISITAATGWEG